MENYNTLIDIRNEGIYDKKNNVKNDDIVKIIHNDYNIMDNVEKKYILTKIITTKDVNRILLNYELTNYTPEKKMMNMNEYIKEAQKMFLRYQHKAGGFNINDTIWTIHKNNSTKYKIKKNEVFFENTIKEKYMEEEETSKYLKNILRLLNNISLNVTTTLHKRQSKRDRIFYIIFRCKKQIDDVKIK